MTSPAPLDQSDIEPVFALAQHVLDTIVGYYETADVKLPERRVVVIGELTVDKEVLGVMFGGTHIGAPGNELSTPMRGEAPTTAVFSVELWRKVDVGRGGARGYRPPKSARVTDDAGMAMIDCWLLQRAALLCDQMSVGVIATTAPLPPQGGLQGINLSLQLQVP